MEEIGVNTVCFGTRVSPRDVTFLDEITGQSGVGIEQALREVGGILCSDLGGIVMGSRIRRWPWTVQRAERFTSAPFLFAF